MGGGRAAQARHRHHIAREGVDKAGADAGPHLADVEGVVRGRALQLRVVAQAQVRLGHADRQAAEAGELVVGDLLGGGGRVAHIVGAVDLRRQGVDLLADRHVERVEELRLRRPALGGSHHHAGQILAAGAALGEHIAHRHADGAGLAGDQAHRLDLRGPIVGVGVQGHHHRHAEAAGVLDLLAQIGPALVHIAGVLGEQLGG